MLGVPGTHGGTKSGLPLSRMTEAEQAVRATGARFTRPRLVVLAILLEARKAMTQAEVEACIPRGHNFDRVTIYRVLDWLTTQGLAHKIAGEDRVWRFNAVGHAHPGPHAHFQCSDCGEVLCLAEAAPRSKVKLPLGYTQQRVEMTIRGLCASCAPAPVPARLRRLP